MNEFTVEIQQPQSLQADIAQHINVDNGIFIAEYNVTTYAEIKAAYDAGKTIFIKSGVAVEELVVYAPITLYVIDEGFVFSVLTGLSGFSIAWYIITETDGWSNEFYDIYVASQVDTLLAAKQNPREVGSMQFKIEGINQVFWGFYYINQSVTATMSSISAIAQMIGTKKLQVHGNITINSTTYPVEYISAPTASSLQLTYLTNLGSININITHIVMDTTTKFI